MTTRIVSTGSALPKLTLTNEDLSGFLDTSDEWIRSRSGIARRQIAGETESVVTLAAEAGRKALENGGIAPEEVQLVLTATCSGESCFPSSACQVQGILGLEKAAAMDLSAACSGFIFALNTAHAYISSGMYENALIIGAETLSRVVDWRDRRSCVLFGDGAGACVVKRGEQGVRAFCQHSDGSRGKVLVGSVGTLPTPGSREHPGMPLSMDGQAVYRFAVKTVPECIREVLDKAGVLPEEVKYFLLHQANSRIIQAAAKRLNLPLERFPMNMEEHGNTSAASIPILLDEMNQKGRLVRGDRILMAGFGAGLTWGAVLLEW